MLSGLVRFEKTTAAFIAALGLVAGLSWLSHRNTDRVIESQAWVLRTQAVIGELRALQTHVTDAESAGRGYVITDDSRFLPPYEQALAATPKHAAVLRSLLAADTGQVKRLDTLFALVRAKLDAVAERIALRREKGFDAAASAVRSMKGQHLMDEIRGLVGEMEREEYRKLSERTAAVKSGTTRASITVGLCAVASIGLLLWVFTARNRELRRRRDAEGRLQASSAYARSLIDASLDPLVTISAEGKITDVNAATEEATGVSGERLIGSDFSAYFTDPEKARAGYQQVFSESLVRDYALAIRHSTGKVTDVLYNAALYKDATGKVQGVFAAARDVTELKRAEAARDRFFNLSLDMLCIAGFDGYFKQLNPAWMKTLGWRNEELLAKPYLEFVHPEDRQPTVDAAQGLAQGKILITFDNRYLCKDGTYKWLSWSCYPLLEDQTIFAIARDVTAQRAHEESLRRAKERAEAANRELEAFSYSVSHDLRAPLRAIDGFSQALVEDYSDKLDAEAKRHIERLRAGARRMARLIDDLLNLSRISRAEIVRRRVDLSELARSIAEDLRGSDPDRAATIAIEDGVDCVCDPSLMRIALENLLGNAWKFTSKQPEARIQFGVHARNGETVYFVRDNGAGFDMTYVDKLFGAFQRLHQSIEFEGEGIGLATVARIVQRHGGRVWPEAAVGKGATFYFTVGGGEAFEQEEA